MRPKNTDLWATSLWLGGLQRGLSLIPYVCNILLPGITSLVVGQHSGSWGGHLHSGLVTFLDYWKGAQGPGLSWRLSQRCSYFLSKKLNHNMHPWAFFFQNSLMWNQAMTIFLKIFLYYPTIKQNRPNILNAITVKTHYLLKPNYFHSGWKRTPYLLWKSKMNIGKVK